MLTTEERNTAVAVKRNTRGRVRVSASNELIKRLTDIDWERRRYEIAREILSSAYACNKYYRSMEIKDMVAEAVESADALIKELKGGEV